MGSLSLLWGNFPNPGINPRSPELQADSLLAEPQGKPFIKGRYSKKASLRDIVSRKGKKNNGSPKIFSYSVGLFSWNLFHF